MLGNQKSASNSGIARTPLYKKAKQCVRAEERDRERESVREIRERERERGREKREKKEMILLEIFVFTC